MDYDDLVSQKIKLLFNNKITGEHMKYTRTVCSIEH